MEAGARRARARAALARVRHRPARPRPGPGAAGPALSSLAARFRAQAEQCGRNGSPLTETLLYGAADDLEGGGAVADLLAPLAADPPGTVPSLRFAGALHRLVLEREAPRLALHYPSVGGTAPVRDVWPAARAAVEDSPARLRDLVARPVQTNEVGRAAALLGGLLHVAAGSGLPVRLLELGASAGLNLRVDDFAYQVGDLVLGDPSSPVVLDQPWAGAYPVGEVRVVERRGCDPAPVDPLTTEGRLTLTSYVWADQVGRIERLRGALQVAARRPATVELAAASTFLARELAAPRAGVATVVWHSVVRQYLAPGERDRVDALLAEAGARATSAAPLYRLSMEPERAGAGSFDFHVDLVSWPGGRRRTLAECQGHGPPVVWR